MPIAPQTETLADPKVLLRVPVGLASPLWPLFAGVAMSGATWWWMTRWAQPANLEAMFGGLAKAELDIPSEPVAFAEPAVETAQAFAAEAEAVMETVSQAATEDLEACEPVAQAAAATVAELETAAQATSEAVSDVVAEAFEAAFEAAPQPEVQPVVEATVEPVLEALPEAALEPVGGEAAPISPVLEASSPVAATPAAKVKKKAAAPKAD